MTCKLCHTHCLSSDSPELTSESHCDLVLFFCHPDDPIQEKNLDEVLQASLNMESLQQTGQAWDLAKSIGGSGKGPSCDPVFGAADS